MEILDIAMNASLHSLNGQEENNFIISNNLY